MFMIWLLLRTHARRRAPPRCERNWRQQGCSRMVATSCRTIFEHIWKFEPLTNRSTPHRCRRSIKKNKKEIGFSKIWRLWISVEQVRYSWCSVQTLFHRSCELNIFPATYNNNQSNFDCIWVSATRNYKHIKIKKIIIFSPPYSDILGYLIIHGCTIHFSL